MSVHAVAEDGYLPAGAGIPSTAMVNTGLITGLDRWFRQDIKGTVLGANLTLTWSPAGPTLDKLRLTFTPIEVRDGGSEFFTGDTRYVEGPSPLELSLNDLGWTEGTYTVAVWWSGDVAAGLKQDFHVEGEIYYA